MAGIPPLARKAAQRIFAAGDRMGVHILPVHYYTPVASRKHLRKTESEWMHPLAPLPFDWDIDNQAQWLADVAGDFPSELPLSELYASPREFRYGPIEAQFLYSWIRANAPARILEIGSGSSTAVMSRAVDRNLAEGRSATAITACDPYTADWVADLPHVTARKVGGQALGEEVLSLGEGDLLFIDSTHVVRTGSELAHLYLELLPRLQPGVIVHIHDIYLPYLFSPNIYGDMFDWQETTLVAALLAGNPGFRVLGCQSALFHERPEALAKTFVEFEPRPMRGGVYAGADDEGHFPASLWLVRQAT